VIALAVLGGALIASGTIELVSWPLGSAGRQSHIRL
jgi:hypothetical protein